MAAVIFNGNFVKALKSRVKAQNEQILPAWQKITIDYLDLQTASPGNTIDLYEMVAKEQLHQIVIELGTQFNGGSISALVASIGIQTDLTKYVPSIDLINPTNTAVYVIDDILSMSVDTFLRLDANASGDNLSALTQGSVDIYLLTSKLPDFTG